MTYSGCPNHSTNDRSHVQLLLGSSLRWGTASRSAGPLPPVSGCGRERSARLPIFAEGPDAAPSGSDLCSSARSCRGHAALVCPE